jgi:eukaryotic-like serine/threonine-protein kinase
VDVGDVVADRYEVKRVLEVGGRSTLLEAFEQDQERFVVVELFRRFRVSQAHERFTRELRSVAELKSAHVARVFGNGTEPDGSHYVVVEPQEGESLETLLRRRGPLPLVRVVDLMLQVCEAMTEAHEAQVVHEDLSPETLFLTHHLDGRSAIKIRDFGVRLATFAITEGRMFGEPRYTAPEQLPQSGKVDPRTDIWALGAVMYELSTGHRPFEQSPAQLEQALLTSHPLPLHELRPGLPAAFSDAVMCCLARSPAARFSSVAELARAIAPYGSMRGQGMAGAVRGVLAAGANRLRESTDRVRDLVRTRRS